jgi:SAM-dependent methyltransferase
MEDRSSSPVDQLAARLRRVARRVLDPAWMGRLRRTTPFSTTWGYERGTPVDRYYVERFLERFSADVRGAVLEIGDARYTRRFGRGVERSHVLDIRSTRDTTIVADLAHADAVASAQFDCFVCTQMLQYVLDVPSALRHAHRMLRPGGVMLATVPFVQRVDPPLADVDYTRFTPALARALFADAFGAENVAVEPMGNVLSCIAILTGLSAQDLSRRELEVRDPLYPAVVTIRASRPRTA